jgi:hypothetical protein
MNTHSDPDNNIHIHHCDDYSGEATIVIPLKERPPAFRGPDASGQHPAGTFDIADPDHDLNVELGILGDAYGIKYSEVQRPGDEPSQWYAVITIPAMVLVRFAASAVHDAMTRQLEQTSLEDLLREHL